LGNKFIYSTQLPLLMGLFVESRPLSRSYLLLLLFLIRIVKEIKSLSATNKTLRSSKAQLNLINLLKLQFMRLLNKKLLLNQLVLRRLDIFKLFNSHLFNWLKKKINHLLLINNLLYQLFHNKKFKPLFKVKYKNLFLILLKAFLKMFHKLSIQKYRKINLLISQWNKNQNLFMNMLHVMDVDFLQSQDLDINVSFVTTLIFVRNVNKKELIHMHLLKSDIHLKFQRF
jgi:hypothetical protein